MRTLSLFLALTVSVAATGPLTPEQEKGKDVFQACGGCHNTLTDARKAAPSLRTLYGKVRLINGKRTLEDNVSQLILDGYNGMPSYRNMFQPEDWKHLLAFLKTLRARPEIGTVLKPIRGSDKEVLESGRSIYNEHCRECHDADQGKAPSILDVYSREKFATGEAVKEAAIVSRVRAGHGRSAPNDKLGDAALFALIAFLKTQPETLPSQ